MKDEFEGHPLSFILSSKQFDQNRLLRVHTVFGLIPDGRIAVIGDVVGDFLPAMGRQTMHDDGVGSGITHQVGINLIGHKNRHLNCRFGLLPHADPRVGVNHLGGLDGGARVINLGRKK